MPDLRVIDELNEDFPESWNKSSSRKIAEHIAKFLLENNFKVNDFDIGKFVIFIKTSNDPEKITRQIIAFKKIDDETGKLEKNLIEIIKIEFEKELKKDFDELELETSDK